MTLIRLASELTTELEDSLLRGVPLHRCLSGWAQHWDLCRRILGVGWKSLTSFSYFLGSIFEQRKLEQKHIIEILEVSG